jgi:serine/threonine protein kinase
MSEERGKKLGHYLLGEPLGSGGMGDVYLAEDLSLRCQVAIKILKAGRGDLTKEAQVLARLDHPHICAVQEIGVADDGRPYMVMRYVEGETLARRLNRGPLSPTEALTLCARIADALAFAHRRRVVHRDLKPQNVMITPSGEPKLLDFGVATLSAAAPDEPTASTTFSGARDQETLAGTLPYMSPEQVQHLPVDGRSDLFSLGAMLFECITGRRAFDGLRDVDVMTQVLHAHPPVAGQGSSRSFSVRRGSAWRHAPATARHLT